MKLYGFDIEFFVSDERLSYLTPVLEQWVKINRDYIEQSPDGNNFYWFNERANLSAFAGAIWRSGGLPSEEYVARKGKNKTVGRIDLHFLYSNTEVICEAKHDWLYLPQNKSKDYITEISKSLNLAISDINHTLHANKPDLGLAVTFIAPYWDAKKCRPHESIEQLKRQLQDVDSSFYIYLEHKTDTPIIKGKNKDEAYSSIILIGKIA